MSSAVGSVLWLYFDPRGLGITLSLSAGLLAVALLLTNRALGRGVAGLSSAAWGVGLSAFGVAVNMLQSGLPALFGLVVAVALMLGGLTMLVAGVSRVRGHRVPAAWLTTAFCVGMGVVVWFGLVQPDVRWRVGPLSLILATLSLVLAYTAYGETRQPHLAGMRLLALFGAVFAVLMVLRAAAAVTGHVSSTISRDMVNVGAVLAGGLGLIGAVAGLLLLLSGNLVSRLEHQRSHDPLTGLWNRHGLRAWIGQLPPEQMLSLAMIDLDHFKQVNDQYGHPVGDQVIQWLAGVLSQAPTGCHAARFGGEEFVLVSPDLSLADLRRVVDGLRVKFGERGPLPACTFSAGVACGPIADIEHVMRLADEALYRAKFHGRNRVES